MNHKKGIIITSNSNVRQLVVLTVVSVASKINTTKHTNPQTSGQDTLLMLLEERLQPVLATGTLVALLNLLLPAE